MLRAKWPATRRRNVSRSQSWLRNMLFAISTAVDVLPSSVGIERSSGMTCAVRLLSFCSTTFTDTVKIGRTIWTLNTFSYWLTTTESLEEQNLILRCLYMIT